MNMLKMCVIVDKSLLHGDIYLAFLEGGKAVSLRFIAHESIWDKVFCRKMKC